jgi:hypothetical protein
VVSAVLTVFKKKSTSSAASAIKNTINIPIFSNSFCGFRDSYSLKTKKSASSADSALKNTINIPIFLNSFCGFRGSYCLKTKKSAVKSPNRKPLQNKYI